MVRKKGKRKEMKITLKSKPKNPGSASSILFRSKPNRKPVNFRGKGTRG